MRKPKKVEQAPEAPAKYEPTKREAAALAAYYERVTKLTPLPLIKASKPGENGATQIAIEHKDLDVASDLQRAALGLTTGPEHDEFLKAAANICVRDGEIEPGQFNAVLSMVAAIGPTNSVEAMLALQMVALHRAAMALASKMRGSCSLEVGSYQAKTFNNLTRTFGVHAETLQKLRTKPGQQRVTVEHRHYYLAAGAIAPGSQAVLGDVTGGGVQTQIEDQSHERNGVLLPERAAMLGALQANGSAMQGPGAGWQEGLPVPRRTRRSAVGLS